MKLSRVQLADLKSLLRPDSPVKRRGITNSTMSALERRGLVKIRREKHESIADYVVYRWYITDAGHAALALPPQNLNHSQFTVKYELKKFIE